MNHNQSQKMKRIVSGLLSLTMITSMSTILPANAETVSSLALDGLAVNNYGYTNVQGIVSDDVVTDIEGTGITIKGDVNSDGKITDDDRELLNKWLTRSIGKNDLDLKNADVNLDGKVNILDLVELNRLCDTVKKTTSKQQIGEDSEILSAINTEDNAFKLSVNISAAGDAQTLLSADESRYSSAIKSDMVVGVVPELEYEEGYAVEEVTLNFDIKDDVTINNDGKYASVSDDFKGVRKFNVFKYFEDIDMLLPIETNYDTESNTVTTTVDELGTYCLVDMEKWFETLGIKPEELANANTAPSSVSMVGTSETTAVESMSANTVGTAGIPVDQPIINSVASTAVTEPGPLDVIFHVYTKNSDFLPDIRTEIVKTSEPLFEKYDDVRVYVATYTGTFASINGNDYATNKSDLETMISNLSSCSEYADFPDLFYGLGSTVNNYVGTSPSESSDRYYILLEETDVETTKLSKAADLLNKNSIKAIVLSDNDHFKGLADYTEGLYYPATSNYSVDVSSFISYKHGRINTDGDDNNDYPIIAATGWKRIELERKISSDFEEISEKIRLGVEPREKYMSEYADTDKDGLLDLEEIRYLVVDKIFGKDIRVTWDKNGKIVLPTLKQVMQMKSGLPYVEDGIKGLPLEYYGDFRILPIKSDPMDKDSDNDGYLDGLANEDGKNNLYASIKDPEPLKNNISIVQLCEERYVQIRYGGEEEETSGYYKTTPNYGGNQSWLFEDSKNFDLLSDSEKDSAIYNMSDEELYNLMLENGGCGITASTDLLIYLSMYNDKCKDLDIKNTCTYDGEFDYNSYIDFYKTIAKQYVKKAIPDNTHGYNQFKDKCGTHPYDISDGLNLFFKDNNISLKVDLDIINTQKRMYKKIKKSINNNVPVIIAIGDSSFLLYEYTKKIEKEYHITKLNRVQKHDGFRHIMTITGVIYNDIEDTYYYIVSSWGERWIIKSDELTIKNTPYVLIPY